MTGSLKSSRALNMTVFSIVTAAFFPNNGLGLDRETVSGKNARQPFRRDIMRFSIGENIPLTVRGVSRGNMK
jgi:hypothetical protein